MLKPTRKTSKLEIEVINWDDGEMTYKIPSGFPGKVIVVTESAWAGIEECKYEDGTTAGEPAHNIDDVDPYLQTK